MTVFVTGSTGLVGKRLIRALIGRGDRIIALSRKPPISSVEDVESVIGDPSRGGHWLDRLADCEAVVHLAGENIFAKRWSESFKSEIMRSRVDSTRLIAERLAANGKPVVFVSTSAVGYYGPGEHSVDEASPPGTDFMAQVCVAWEAAAGPARNAGIRVVHPRFGIVLDDEGGALPYLARPFRFYVGGPVGNGKQGVSWVHRDDVTRALLFLLDHPIHGPVNVTAPEPVSNREFSKALAKALHRPSWLPIPGFAIRAALGEVAEVATAGQWVTPNVLVKNGFAFQFPDVTSALTDLLSPRPVA